MEDGRYSGTTSPADSIAVDQYALRRGEIEYTHSSAETAWTCNDRLSIVNGYQKSASAFKQNSRVKAMNLQVNGVPRGRVVLEDRMGEQIVSLPVQRGDRVRLTITAVYPGSKYKDTALTEAWVTCVP